MPVGSGRPGKPSLSGTKVHKDKRDDRKSDDKEPESPVKVKSEKPAAATQKSQAGQTADEAFHDLRLKVRKAGGPDLKTEGWTCKLVPSAKEGAASGTALAPCWVEPATGKEFLKRRNVLRHLSLKETAEKTQEQAATESRENFRIQNKEEPLPQKIGEVTVLQWGKVAPDRENFHSSRHIWPIGFKSRWTDENAQDITYESEIRDGNEDSGAPDHLSKIDGPIFVVCVTRKGEDKPTEFFGKNGKQVWRRATKDEKAKDHTGLRIDEVCKRLEGLRNAAMCKNYEFIATRPPLLDPDEVKSPKKKKKKSKAANGDTDPKTKVAGKKRKADSQPKKDSQKTKRAREREEKLQEKAKEKEEKEKKHQQVAEEKRLVREEEARKRKEAKELQDIEQKWLSRYPIEDLAIELETRAMEEAKAAGHHIPAQRAAARAVVDAVERGWGQTAVLAAGKEAAECRAAGDNDEEAHERAIIKGEEMHEANRDTSAMAMDVDDTCCIDDELLCRVGTRVKMLFKTGETDQKFTGFVSKCSDESNNISIDFYDENPNWEVPKNDQDVEILGQGVLLLPPLVQKPQRAPIHNADVLNVARFVEAFKAELKLPKGSLADLQDGLEKPDESDYISLLYQALLIGAMEAAKDANPNAIVPVAWQGDNTLSQHTWPEIARRWITCGPHAELNKKRFPEAVAAATCLSAAAGGAKSRPEGHLKLLLCLIEECFDHGDIHSAVDQRLEVEDEAKKTRDEKVKEFIKDEKQVQERIKAARESVAKVDVSDEGPDLEPVPDEATKKAIESESAEANEKGGELTESEEDKALRDAFDEKRAEWKKRRDERGGKAADKELNDALRQEKRLNDQRNKTETDCAAKLEKFSLRQAPLGMDRNRNKYWWFAADPATLYVEPPMPLSGQAQPDPANYSFEWRMWCGAEAMKQLADCLCEQGLREYELKAGIQKVVEKLGTEEQQLTSRVRAHLKLKEPDDLKFLVSFQFALQEAKNIEEVFNPDQRKTLSQELPDWQKILETPLDCDQMSKLLQHLEHAVYESTAHTKPNKRAVAASRARDDVLSAAASTQNGIDDPVADNLTHDVPEEWQNDTIYATKKVRRNVLGEDGTHAGKANGTVVGYIPVEKSDFKSKQTHLDAALWRIKFDDPDIGDGFEDLEEYEVKQAIADYEKMQASLQSAASLRGGVVPTRGDAADSGAGDAGGSEVVYDEGAIDMAEASNKVTGALWTSAMQREAWRREVESAASANSVVRVCYSASVLCENVLRVMHMTRNDLSTAPRRTRTERTKRNTPENAMFTGFTETGRRVKRVNYCENGNKDSDDSD